MVGWDFMQTTKNPNSLTYPGLDVYGSMSVREMDTDETDPTGVDVVT